jgi:GT2 family glycosyltransferase
MEYKFITEPSGPKSVTVITPTIGQDYLLKAISSVSEQTYQHINHLIVVDGPAYFDKVKELLGTTNQNLNITCTPENTGSTGGNFYGHRIYAGYPHLINSDYIAFLDEDNWYEPDHIESLVNTLESKNYDWVYSMRNFYKPDGEFVSPDCCESLGLWPIYFTLNNPQPEYLIDTSAYLFKREFLIQVCQNWHSGWGGDRRFYHSVSKVLKHTNYNTTGKHTLCYRLDEDVEKKYGGYNFFTEGNAAVLKHYGGYPWLKI